jgi:hypothetical protein
VVFIPQKLHNFELDCWLIILSLGTRSVVRFSAYRTLGWGEFRRDGVEAHGSRRSRYDASGAKRHRLGERNDPMFGW